MSELPGDLLYTEEHEWLRLEDDGSYTVGITDHAWQPGDRVITSGLEHHALSRPVTQLAGRGVEIGTVPR